MQHRPRRLFGTVITALCLLMAWGGSARAARCNVAIMGQGAKYVRDTLKMLQRCEVGIRNGRIQPQECRSEEKAARRTGKAAVKFRQRVRLRCAGLTPAQIGPLPPECQAVSTTDALIECLLGVLDTHVDGILANEFGCPGRCGDAVADKGCGEECDGTDLAGKTCVNLGFAGGGTLLCTPACIFYTGNCVP